MTGLTYLQVSLLHALVFAPLIIYVCLSCNYNARMALLAVGILALLYHGWGSIKILMKKKTSEDFALNTNMKFKNADEERQWETRY
jgi:hypothetical protein